MKKRIWQTALIIPAGALAISLMSTSPGSEKTTVQNEDHSGHDHSEHDHSEHDHSGHDHSVHDHSGHDHSRHDHSVHDHSGHDHSEHDHSGHDHSGHDMEIAPEECLIPKETQLLLGIRTELAAEAKYTSEEILLGTVLSQTNGKVEVRSAYNATVTNIFVRVGEKVKKGQALASLRYNINSVDRLELLSKIEEVNADLNQVKAERDRLEELSDVVATKRLVEVKIEIERLTNLLKQYKASSNGSGTQALTIRSSIDGVVGDFELSVGQQLSESEEILSIYNSGLIKVEATLYSSQKHHLDDSVQFVVSKLGEQNSGSVIIADYTLSPNVNRTNQTYTVTLFMTESDVTFSPGQQVKVELQSFSDKKTIVVNTEAIIEHQGTPVVFVHAEPEKFRIIPIESGIKGNSSTSIVKGIEEGERVVTKAAHRVHAIYLSK